MKRRIRSKYIFTQKKVLCDAYGAVGDWHDDDNDYEQDNYNEDEDHHQADDDDEDDQQ